MAGVDVSEVLCRLPERQIEKRRTDPDRCGASWEVARSLGLKKPPLSWLIWVHGVYWEAVNHPAWLAYTNTKGYRILVHTSDQEELLRQNGYRDVHAVGAPILYAADGTDVERIPRSLLVMPPHSLVGTVPDWDEERYVREICSLREHYDLIVVCVVASCVSNGLWVRSFEKAGIPCVEGAHGGDINSLRRMAILFRSFETVTSCLRGSQIPYAAYFGSKVCLWGQWAGLGRDDGLLDQLIHRRFPETIEHAKLTHDYRYNAEAFPFLFRHPTEAECPREWGAELLGAEVRKSPEELQSIFGWKMYQRIWNTLTKAPAKCLHRLIDQGLHRSRN